MSIQKTSHLVISTQRMPSITMAATKKTTQTPAKKPVSLFGKKQAATPAKKGGLSFGGKPAAKPPVSPKISKGPANKPLIGTKTNAAKPAGKYNIGAKKPMTPAKTEKKGFLAGLFGQKPAQPPTKGKK